MKKQLTFITLATSIMLVVPAFSAQQQHVAPATTKACENAVNNQLCAKTMSSVFDVNGRLWSAWTNKQHLYINYSDDEGVTFSSPVKVNSRAENISARNEHRPKIKVSEKGIIYLSWTTKLSKRFTGNIRFSRSVDNGKSFSRPVTINDDKQIISHRFDALAVNKNGDIFISWLDKRDQQQAKISGKEYNGAAAYYAVSLDHGITFSENKKIADNSCECCRMAIDIDQQDLPVIAWRHIYGENIRDHSIVNFKDKLSPGTPKRLSYDNWKIKGCPHHGPSLSIDTDNNYHAVWFNNGKQRHGIYYANSDDNGTNFNNIKSIGNYNKQASHADVISINQNIYITWKEFHAPYTKIFLMKSVDRGSSWSEAEEIAQTSHQNDHPFLLRKLNKAYISWQITGHKYHLIPVK